MNIWADISDDKILLGISTYVSEDYEAEENKNVDKKKFIFERGKLWKKIDNWSEAIKYFGTNVHYRGYLLNHDKKLAVNLEDYFAKSLFSKNGSKCSIDLIPVLTGTCGGTLDSGMRMLFFDGVDINCTENLDGTWCGDKLQIAENLPEGYKVIDCCFAGTLERADYFYEMFGVDDKNFILRDAKGTRFQCAKLSIRGNRGIPQYLKIERDEEKQTLSFVGSFVDKTS